MVQLANSDKLAVRYAPYIQELREFFFLHDVLCGAPRELGFFAARLSGRDTFPDELASMVRSFIFREGGAFPHADLRTVVALAVGGPAVAQSAGELQHPLHDLSTFLAAVVHGSLDQSRPSPLADDAAEETHAIPYAAASPYPASIDTEAVDSENPFRPPLASNASLSRAVFPSSSQISPSPFTKPVHNRRTLWAVLAVGLPLVLLFAFLYHQPGETSPSPDTAAVSSGPASSSLFAAQPPAPTPFSNAAEALAHPAPADATLPGTPAPPASGQPHATTLSKPASSSASPSVASPSQPTGLPPGVPSAPVAPAAASKPTSPAPAPPPAPQSTVAESSPAPRPSPPRAAPLTPSVATVTAQQGAFGVSSGIMSSHLVSFSPPRYPTMAGFAHAQGQVILQAVVSKTGSVSAVKAITGPRTLRKAAETAVRQWRYRPYVTDGHAADIATIITIDVKSPH